MTNQEDTREFYDNEALVTRRYSSKNFWENRYHNKRMAILQGLMKKAFGNCETILDVGCGTGEYLWFSRRLASQVYGLDISKQYLNRYGSREEYRLILGDARYLPFRNQAFDCVLCSEVIEHIKPNERAIGEIFRVSHRSIIISTPNHGILRMILAKTRRNKLLLLDSSVGHVNIVRFADLISKFKGSEWKISVSFTANIFPPFLDNLHFPKNAAQLIALLETIMDRLFPKMGSVSVAVLEFNVPEVTTSLSELSAEKE